MRAYLPYSMLIPLALFAAGCGFTEYKNAPTGTTATQPTNSGTTGTTGTTGGTGTTTGTGTSSPVTFTQVNQDILQPKCLGCHSGGSASGGVDLSSYNSVMTKVVAGNPNQSQLYEVVQSGQMPQGSSALSQAELSEVYDWIEQGAQNN